MVQGFKGKSVSIEKIIKTTIDQLQKQAGSKFDPSMTVVKAKGLRNKPETAIEESKVQEEKEEIAPAHRENEFPLPDNAGKLGELASIVTQNVGPIFVKIGSKEFQLNEIGVQKIKDLLG